ncbi:Hypothetical predicted protein [Scomber scombrus]|uniref:Uncharacterized protein n=1 Tax=Scomber scombrus TaxID=13677 RepID=A0AAV1PYE2_SCOSC
MTQATAGIKVPPPDFLVHIVQTSFENERNFKEMTEHGQEGGDHHEVVPWSGNFPFRKKFSFWEILHSDLVQGDTQTCVFFLEKNPDVCWLFINGTSSSYGRTKEVYRNFNPKIKMYFPKNNQTRPRGVQ